ncbi:MAG TPA: acyl carrier protein, partial [Mycobacterium sp.]|nr:acyl carrier protein [Mycobacterium sp.]
ALLDAALLADRAVVVAARLNTAGLSAAGAAVAPLWRELVTRPARRVVDATDTAASIAGLAARLHTLSPRQRHRELVELVSHNAATVLGHASTIDIDIRKAFQELGFDSLTGVELRNRLKTATGLALPPTLIYDYPTPAVLAEHLDHRFGASTTATATALTDLPCDDDLSAATERQLFAILDQELGP